MKETFERMKQAFAGKWSGRGFAKFPTIEDTDYTEHLEVIPDENKDGIFYNQKTLYMNLTPKNGHTVFWDCGFIFLKNEKIRLHSTQIGGRIEQYELVDATDVSYTFNSLNIENDPKSIKSQRILSLRGDKLHYELNMATHQADFQNHLVATLKKDL
jgi:hypothetical protein